MRRMRTIWFNDTRHFYLYTLEPPLSLEDLWRPVDEAAGTAVDTFAFSVEGGAGLFYPSRVGRRFTERSDVGSYTWRAYQSLRDLDERGIDILAELIDRAHAQDMGFFASLRMHGYAGMDPDILVMNGGIGLGDAGVRDHLFGVIEELATQYDTQGVELDLAAPGGTAWHFPKEQGPKYAPVMTEYLGRIAAMIRGREGGPGELGVRVYPTEEMCRRHGMDVRAWFEAGIVDWVMPMYYPYFVLDGDMPIEWLTEAAAAADVSVYGRLQPWIRDESTGAPKRLHADTETLRGAACNYLTKGADGLYAHSMSWPLGKVERGFLSELGDFKGMMGRDKRYVLRRRQEQAASLGYDAVLPFEIPAADPQARHPVPLFIADDVEEAGDRVRRVILTLSMRGTVGADRIGLRLNGAALPDRPTSRRPREPLYPYDGLDVVWDLDTVRPVRGANQLEISLDARPAGLEGGITIEAVELLVEYEREDRA